VRKENAEFIALFKASGWKQNYTAKRLHVAPATISRYLSKDPEKQIPPSEGTNELFKMILANEQPDKLVPTKLNDEGLSESESKLIEELRLLHRDDRHSVEQVMRTMISRLPKRAPISYLNSAPKRTASNFPFDPAAEAKVKDILNAGCIPKKSAGSDRLKDATSGAGSNLQHRHPSPSTDEPKG
jgi:predicted transcriptional regulator